MPNNVEMITVDGNEAVGRVAYAYNEVIAIYPITPASPMGEWADQWAAAGKPNLWGKVPRIVEMQSEAGAAGVVHGSLQAGALTTTFTASQGLLLMIPNMYKIAGELTPAVIHVAARTLASQALSIFGDHSDVMAARATGWAMLCSGSVQEAADFAAIAQAATLESRIPFMHFFDGFRTSHEISKIKTLSRDQLLAMVDANAINDFRRRGLSPDHPVIRGTAQNPDVFFQAREASNPYYLACPRIVTEAMIRFGELTGRHYQLFDYTGHPEAEQVIVLMGSGAEAAEEAVEALTLSGRKLGLVRVRLFRPFDTRALLDVIPPSVKQITVLDRTREPGATGDPLYLDVLATFAEAPDRRCRITAGRYGLSSKEFTPAMVKRIFDEGDNPQPRNHFTIGIHDDLTHTSLAWDPDFSTEDPQTVRAVFYGLGADGTVGANKNSIKIIGEETNLHVQGYFVYDSKKSGSTTISHLRFGPKPIRATYLIDRAGFVACHQYRFLQNPNLLDCAMPGATFLLNSPYPPEVAWSKMPLAIRNQIRTKQLNTWVIDAVKVAREAGLGGRTNTIMQTCFFAISGILEKEQAIQSIKKAIEKSYGKRGPAVVRKNHEAVDAALAHLHRLEIPAEDGLYPCVQPDLSHMADCPALTAQLIAGHGEQLPVSAMPVDGTFPTGTTRFEKRNIAQDIPVWDPDVCIQCGKCVMVCPHAVIRGKVYDPSALSQAPEGFLSSEARWKEFHDRSYSLQVAPEDCTGCGLCVAVCPAKNRKVPKLKAINMAEAGPLMEKEKRNWDFFLSLPDPDRDLLNHGHVKDVQLMAPLFEFSGACAGCGETPYLKLASQLFGDRMLIANATGCSSIYGGNLPTTPWSKNAQGRGPAWANSLFEDNAEFGLGMRLAMEERHLHARSLLPTFAHLLGDELVEGLLEGPQLSEADIQIQRDRVALVKDKLAASDSNQARDLLALADDLVRKSVWIIGGDGWAYDIGYGGLDHVIAGGYNVNILVLDTEVYSNTGGQASKSTPRAAVAKFASGGKRGPKKDLALMAMSYGNAYVAAVAMGGNDAHTIKVFREAESFEGPSLIIAYSHCIAHGYDLVHGIEQQKAAVNSGYWPLFRYDPRVAVEGHNALQLDSRAARQSLKSFLYNETRYTMLAHGRPEVAADLLAQAGHDVDRRWALYQHLAGGPGHGSLKTDHKENDPKENQPEGVES